MNDFIDRSITTILLALATTLAMGASAQTEHYHPKGKMPSKHTIAVIEQARASLPFSDMRDFDLVGPAPFPLSS